MREEEEKGRREGREKRREEERGERQKRGDKEKISSRNLNLKLEQRSRLQA